MKIKFNIKFGKKKNNTGKRQAVSEKYILTKYFLTWQGFKKLYPDKTKQDYKNTIDKQLVMMSNMFVDNATTLVEGARGYGKSECAMAKITTNIINNPNETYLIQTLEADRGKGMLAKITEVLILEGVKLSEKNKTSIRTKNNKNDKIKKLKQYNKPEYSDDDDYFHEDSEYEEYKKDPTIKILGAGSGGRRGRHPDKILIDDIITIEKNSEAFRKQSKNVYTECLALSPSVSLLGQRCHELDIYGELRASKEVICKQYYHGYLPHLDIDIEKLRGKGASERSIQANYFGRLLPSDDEPFASIPKRDFYFSPENTTTATLDLAFGGGDKLGLSIGRVSQDNNIYVKCFGYKSSVYDEYDTIIKELRANNVSHLIVEATKTFKNVLFEFKNRLEKHNIKVSSYVPSQNKQNRIEEYVSYYQKRLVLYDNIDANDVLYWSRNAKSDDVIDSLTMLLYYFRSKNI